MVELEEKLVVVMVYIPLSWGGLGSALIQGWEEMSRNLILSLGFFFNKFEIRSFTSAVKFSGRL